MNRKATSAATSILVFMVLALCVGALASFYLDSGKIKAEIADTSFVDKVYADEASWKDMAFLSVREKYAEEYARADLNRDTADVIEKNIESAFDDFYIDNGRGVEERKKASIDIENNQIDVSLEEFPISGSVTLKDKKRVWFWGIVPLQSYDEIKAFIAVVYRPKIGFTIDIEKEGLHSFEKIETALVECRDDASKMESCLGNILFNFNVNVVKSDTGMNVILESKKRFLLDGEIKTISFDVDVV